MLHLLTSLPLLVPLDSTGFLNWADTKNAALQKTLRGVALTLGLGFVIYQGVVSKGSIARIAVSAIAAGLFVWVVYNVVDLKNRADDEVNSAGSVVAVQQPPAATHS